VAQYAVLQSIYFSSDQRLSQAEIMRMRAVSSANVTRLIHGLERSGMVTRDVNPDDKRSTFVYLTEEGFDFCQRLIPAVGKEMTMLGDCFSDAELAIFNELLERLHVHIEEMSATLGEESQAIVLGLK
jgi:DNA-binding MarR family transcriptional regulator